MAFGMKKCLTCKIEKAVSEFYKYSQRDGLQPVCKDCGRKYKKSEKYKETQRIYNKKYYQTNLDKQKERASEYRRLNPDKVKASKESYRTSENGRRVKNKHGREYSRNKRNTDIQFKLACSLRARIWQAIKNNSKSGSAVRDLGCTIPELKFYLEGKFQDGMIWDNWNPTGWHINHTIPLAFFDLTNRDQFLQAVHYTNLQPMWAKDNLRKGIKLQEGVALVV